MLYSFPYTNKLLHLERSEQSTLTLKPSCAFSPKTEAFLTVIASSQKKEDVNC